MTNCKNLQALNDSIEFERELTEKFGGPSAALAQAADASALEVEEELQVGASGCSAVQ